jgi:hypothetical protein
MQARDKLVVPKSVGHFQALSCTKGMNGVVTKYELKLENVRKVSNTGLHYLIS